MTPHDKACELAREMLKQKYYNCEIKAVAQALLDADARVKELESEAKRFNKRVTNPLPKRRRVYE